MWTCPKCKQQFVQQNKPHSCNERTVEDFLQGKPEQIADLFHYFIEEYLKMGPFVLHPARSRIAFAADVRFGYFKYIGKDFIDIALTFNKPFEDNLCFYRIGEVPGGKYFQHYLRIMRKEDVNEEVRRYMKMALENAKR